MTKEKKKPLVSVIVPAYSVEKYIHRCLDSIVNQTYGNLEIIIIDDASKDSTPQIIREYAEKDKRIKAVFHEVNMGAAASRNEALIIASGKYVAFIDSDDWQDLTKYEKMVGVAERTGAEIVFCEMELYNEADDTYKLCYRIPDVFSNSKKAEIRNRRLIDPLLNDVASCSTATKLTRLDFIRRACARFETENTFDDILFHYVLTLSVHTVAFVKEILHTYRKHFDGTSITNDTVLKHEKQFDIFLTWGNLYYISLIPRWNRRMLLIRFLYRFKEHFLSAGTEQLRFYRRVKMIFKAYGLKRKQVPKHLLTHYDFFMFRAWRKTRKPFIKEFVKKLIMAFKIH